MRRAALLTLTMTLTMTLLGCVEPDPCVDWVGTWRGTFTGTVDGRTFDLSGPQFQLQVIASSDQPLVSISRTNWQLGGGYSASIVAFSLSCSERQLDFSEGVYCTLRRENQEGDNCELPGALFRGGDGSGSFVAPTATDRSPTYRANGTWTLSR